MLSKLPLLDSGWSECREVFGQVLMSRRKIHISVCAIMVMLEHLCNTLNEILCIRHFYYLVIGRGFCGRGRKEKQFWFLVFHLALCLCVSAANVSNIKMRRPTYQEHWDVKRCEIKFQQVVRYMLARKFNFHFLSLNYVSDVSSGNINCLLHVNQPVLVSFPSLVLLKGLKQV